MYSVVREVKVERTDNTHFYMECAGTKLNIEVYQYASPDDVERLIMKLSNAIQPKISYYFGK